MHVWRICYNKAIGLHNLAYGSTLGPMRWHLPPSHGGRPVVYAAESRALAQLEKRVHANGVEPVDQALLRLELPAACAIEDAAKSLDAARWKTDEGYTQAYGVSWLQSERSLGLWVPSLVEPQERNLLINPHHAQFAMINVVVEIPDFKFDPRLFR